MKNSVVLWFRRDLRLSDNRALLSAISSKKKIIPIFILDEKLKTMGAAQKWWLEKSLKSLDSALRKLGSRLILRKGSAEEVIEKLIYDFGIDSVFWNKCYTHDAIEQENRVINICRKSHVVINACQGNVLFEPDEIKTLKGRHFSVYTPFWNNVSKLSLGHAYSAPLAMPACPQCASDNLSDWNLTPDWSLKFENNWDAGEGAALKKLSSFLDSPVSSYEVNRNFPGINGTSCLSPHLHFGEISVREIWNKVLLAKQNSVIGYLNNYTTFLKELVWREFCYALYYHENSLGTQNFRKEFDNFPWSENSSDLDAWKKGQTGYPIVDAGMRQLWATGWMHNRVRMIVASFLTKNLLVHWRIGESWFWDTLVDADQASNCVNWQWVAGCGPDAAPYFRIFNPVLQSEKFDAKGDYIRSWVPELKNLGDKHIHAPFQQDDLVLSKAGVRLGVTYALPVVDLNTSRKRALEAYKIWVKP